MAILDGGKVREEIASSMREESLSFLAAAKEQPESYALITDQKSYTFQELVPIVTRVISSLMSLGLYSPATSRELHPQLRVAVLGTSQVKTILLVYALIELGIPFVMIHPRLTETEQKRILQQSQVSFFFGSEWELPLQFEESLLPFSPLPMKQPLVESPLSAQPLYKHPPIEHPLAILYTSGTSGQQKGAILSRRAFLASAFASAANLGWKPEDRWLLCMPIAHVGGLSILIRCLIARRPVMISSTDGLIPSFDPKKILSQIDHHQVTLVSLVPTMLKKMLDEEPSWKAPSCLRAILLGGAASSKSLLSQIIQKKLPVLTTYGLTEACSQVTVQRYGTPVSLEQGVGFSVQGMEVRVKEGEVQIRGLSLFSGYLTSQAGGEERWERKEETKKVEGIEEVEGKRAQINKRAIMEQNVEVEGEVKGKWGGTKKEALGKMRKEEAAEKDFLEDGWFSTGDLGYFDAQSQLHILSRRTDLILSGGENVYPKEIEHILEQYPGIKEVVVFGVPDETWGQLVAIAVVKTSLFQQKQLQEYIRTHLASYKRPRKLVFLDKIPLNALGKVNRSALLLEVINRLVDL